MRGENSKLICRVELKGILPSNMSDIPLEFGSLEEYGCFVGSGGIVVFFRSDNIKQIVLESIKVLCRRKQTMHSLSFGLRQAYKSNSTRRRDEVLIEDIISVMRDASICGLGQAAPNPLSISDT